MKFVNPGMPQVMDYQTMNKLSIGIDDNAQYTTTGYYINLSANDTDVFYKVIDPVEQCYILFDLVIGKDVDSINTIDNWIKIFDIYNDFYPNNNIQLCYRQYKQYKFELALMLSDGTILGDSWYVSTNELNTYEFYFNRGFTTTIIVYENCVQQQEIITNKLAYDDSYLNATTDAGKVNHNAFNRFNFYCIFEQNMTISVSHIIYSDEQRINNERIKMLTTDVKRRIIPSNSEDNFVITSSLDGTLYKEITGFGLISEINNSDDNNIVIKEFLGNSAQFNTIKVLPSGSVYNSIYIAQDPRTSSDFKASDVTNSQIVVSSTVI